MSLRSGSKPAQGSYRCHLVTGILTTPKSCFCLEASSVWAGYRADTT